VISRPDTQTAVITDGFGDELVVRPSVTNLIGVDDTFMFEIYEGREYSAVMLPRNEARYMAEFILGLTTD